MWDFRSLSLKIQILQLEETKITWSLSTPDDPTSTRDRVQKLKDARTEAAREIEEYKAKKDADFNKFGLDHSSETTSSQTTSDAQTKIQLSELDVAVEKNKHSVIDKIVERVLQCDPHLHQNLRKVEA
ncbi:V-type ATPase, G subunit [Tremella mesenterica]|uniref:V-type proton ATPase subunit G n=1 Tax=Tremella mesenterica TaxID=5217 RepID=A0A4V1M438_TREME|nr:V-type ATPase, G subunit [Tremella mesenterica]